MVHTVVVSHATRAKYTLTFEALALVGMVFANGLGASRAHQWRWFATPFVTSVMGASLFALHFVNKMVCVLYLTSLSDSASNGFDLDTTPNGF
jgi:hypothetical protein